MNRKHLLGLYFVLLLSACANPLPPRRPDFSGTWVIDKVNSKLQFPDSSTLEKAVIVIEHHEPNVSPSARSRWAAVIARLPTN